MTDEEDSSTSYEVSPRWRVFRAAEGAEVPSRDSGTTTDLQMRRPPIPAGTPFLLSPDFEYDVHLNAFFYSNEMLGTRIATRRGYASDLARFLTFLTCNRAGRGWRDCEEGDHLAYFAWRREDPEGPRVAPSTWDREVAAVNRFYTWQVKQGHVRELPIPQRARRRPPGRRTSGRELGTTPATRSHAGTEGSVRWLPSKSYRLWRDVGVRGYTPGGLPNQSFRGRWASRNATFMDLMVRTGLRLSEQSSLLQCELPALRQPHGFHRFTLPAAIAKGRRARAIYLPSGILRDIHEYVDVDRPLLIERGQRRGLYRWQRGAFLLDPQSGRVHAHGSSESFRLSLLTYGERRRVLVEGVDGLEPGSLWLAESGEPMSASSWQEVFRVSNERCAEKNVSLAAHAHLLRHSFAVITLEHMQRGHIESLRDLSPRQRTEWDRVFGDPLDWLRIRLGHRSRETTHIYLHTLAELEMETRMALIPDEWEDSRDPSLLAGDAIGKRG